MFIQSEKPHMHAASPITMVEFFSSLEAENKRTALLLKLYSEERFAPYFDFKYYSDAGVGD